MMNTATQLLIDYPLTKKHDKIGKAQYYKDNREDIKAKAIVNYWKNREANVSRSRRYYAFNKPKIREINRKKTPSNWFVPLPPDKKICTKCNKLKGFGKFPKDKIGKDGLHSICKECHTLRNKLKVPSNWFVPISPDSHLCFDCGYIKKKSEFHRSFRSVNGISGICKVCASIRKIPLRVETNKKKRAVRNSHRHTTLVYFVFCEGWIKIGKTINFHERMISINQSGAKHPIYNNGKLPHLYPLEIINGSNMKELNIHNLFPIIRYGDSEWFKATPKLYDFISKVDIAS